MGLLFLIFFCALVAKMAGMIVIAWWLVILPLVIIIVMWIVTLCIAGVGFRKVYGKIHRHNSEFYRL